MKEEKSIRFSGLYWWTDSKNVTSILNRELKKVLEETRISHITITGSDFNDGKACHTIEITVDTTKNTITVKKNLS